MNGWELQLASGPVPQGRAGNISISGYPVRGFWAYASSSKNATDNGLSICRVARRKGSTTMRTISLARPIALLAAFFLAIYSGRGTAADSSSKTTDQQTGSDASTKTDSSGS